MHNYVIALYIRLSVEDFKTESLSIPNQKLILREKAMSLSEWDNSEILEFIDNGHTGTNFERPAVQELLTMVQAGKINCIIVKDLSRFGHIPAITLANKILESNINPSGITFEISCVKIITDGNKTGVVKRKYPLNKIVGFNAVTSKSGKVFYNNTVDLSGLNHC